MFLKNIVKRICRSKKKGIDYRLYGGTNISTVKKLPIIRRLRFWGDSKNWCNDEYLILCRDLNEIADNLENVFLNLKTKGKE